MKLIVLKNNVPLNEVSVETSDAHEMYEIYVGRSEDCHVQIDDPLISRHHFVLKNENSTWYCEKLSQLGMVSLNGALVTKNPVQNGDEIKCGAYSLMISDLATTKPKVPVQIEEPAYAGASTAVVEESITKMMASSVQSKAQSVPEEVVELVHEPAPEKETDLMSDEESVKDSEFSDNLSNLDFQSNEASSESLDFNQQPSEQTEANDTNFDSELTESPDFADENTEASGENYEVATTENDQNENTRFFKAFVNYQLVLFGEHAPYDRYQIDTDEVFIGRDTRKCQIVLNDPEVSSVHAVIKKNLSEVTLEDLNSSNGTILNGERINKATITAGDEFVIGGTSFTLETKSDLLESESDRLMPVESGQVVETEEIVEEEMATDGEINFSADAPPEKNFFKRLKTDPQFKKKVYIAAIVLIGVIFLLPDEEPTEAPKVTKEAPKVEAKSNETKLNLSKEMENARNVAYELGVNYFEQSRFDLAQVEFQKVVSIDPNYKKVQSYLEQTNVGLKRLQELEAEKRAEEGRIKTKKLVEELLVKARDAVKEKKIQVAESLFSQITEKDPENFEVTQLKLELESWQKEEERKALERAAKEAARKKMVDALMPGKTFYIKKEWYKAIDKLENFIQIKGIDEDLLKEGSEMLTDAKNQLASEVGPILGKARSLKEGQDLKGAYEAYLEVNKMEPTNKEALNEIDEIKNLLDSRSKKVYREAIIAESLSLFGDAKEKFQEVQQISPTDSEYYKKATEKLRNYLE